MANSIRLRFMRSGFQAVLNVPSTRADISERGKRIAEAAGEGVVSMDLTANFGGSKRPMTVVATDSIAAMRRQSKSDSLSKAIDAGR